MSPEGRRRLGAQVGGGGSQEAAEGTCSLALGRGRRPKGTGGLLAEVGGERSQGVAGTAAAEHPHTQSQASGAVDGDASQPDLPTCSSGDLTPPASHHEKRSPSSELPIFSVLNTHTHRQAHSFARAEPSGSQPQTPDPGEDPFTSWTPKPS